MKRKYFANHFFKLSVGGKIARVEVWTEVELVVELVVG